MSAYLKRFNAGLRDVVLYHSCTFWEVRLVLIFSTDAWKVSEPAGPSLEGILGWHSHAHTFPVQFPDSSGRLICRRSLWNGGRSLMAISTASHEPLWRKRNVRRVIARRRGLDKSSPFHSEPIPHQKGFRDQCMNSRLSRVVLNDEVLTPNAQEAENCPPLP